MRLPRVYHPVSKWEETDFNMWGECEDHDPTLELAITFTGDHEKYGHYMRRVTREWPISCENALTDYNLNRKAWLGHAACALYAKIPEWLTREAWRHLTHEQQLLANNQAREAIRAWERRYRKDKQLHPGVGEQMLLIRNPGRSSISSARNRKSAELSRNSASDSKERSVLQGPWISESQ